MLQVKKYFRFDLFNVRQNLQYFHKLQVGSLNSSVMIVMVTVEKSNATQKYFLDPVRDDRNFPTSTGEHFAVAAVAAAVDIT